MSLERWAPITPQLAELQARCYICCYWKPTTEMEVYHQLLALEFTYVCIDCLADPLEELYMYRYGWRHE